MLARLVSNAAGDGTHPMGSIYRKHGDLGDVAEEMLQGVAAATIGGEPSGSASSAAGISLAELAAAFETVAALRLPAQKAEVLRKLFERATPGEVKYIIKIVTGDLRLGSKASLVEEAIAKAHERPLAAVRRANMLLGDIGETLQKAFSDDLGGVQFRLFHAIDFMLATPVETPDEIFEDCPGGVLAEEKYDGIRAQAHKSGNRVKIFSRTLDEVVEFPELVAPLLTLPGEFIVDGEILAWHDSQPLPFTQLQKRLGRKRVDLWMTQEIPVQFVIFDVLYRDGELLLEMPLAQRRERLADLVSGHTGAQLRMAPEFRCESAESLAMTFRAALAAGHEGIVAKSPSSLYTPGRRGRTWFKLKQPFATLDVVVTAVEYGHGKRRAMLSDYTFAVRDADGVRNIGKAYSGLTDAEIKEYTEYFSNHTIEDQGFRKLVEPNVVLEIAFNNIQHSSRHDSGFALRFPRIVRLRTDKTADQIDTLDRVRELYSKQLTLPRTFQEPGAKS